MDKEKVIKSALGGGVIAIGVSLKLAEYGLHISQVLLSGAKNLANEFVKAPDLKIGESLLGDLKKGTGKLADKIIQKGKGLSR